MSRTAEGYIVSGHLIEGCNLNDPAQVEAWWGVFGWGENLRKVVLASAREIVRAKYAASGDKPPSEARIDDLARTSDNYIEFLQDALQGRQRREDNLRQAIGA